MINYIRNCPNCDTKIEYLDKRAYKNASIKNTNCKKCTGLLNGKKYLGKPNNKNRTGKDIKCEECGKLHYKSMWDLKKDKKHFCSKICSSKYHSKKLTKHTYTNKKCIMCGSDFKLSSNRKKYCSVKCSSTANLKTINGKSPKKYRTVPELRFMKMLESNNVAFVFQKSVQWKNGWKKWYDFYIPSHNILVEIDGVYWHGKNINTKDLNKQQWNTRKNDKLKNYLAKIRGYNLIRFWSDELENINIKQILECYE